MQMLPGFSMMNMKASRKLGHSSPTGKPETGSDMSKNPPSAKLSCYQCGPCDSVLLSKSSSSLSSSETQTQIQMSG